ARCAYPSRRRSGCVATAGNYSQGVQMTEQTGTPLNATTRQQVMTLIKTKQSNVVNALQKEVSADEDAIMRKLLEEHGSNATFEEVRSELYRLERLARDAETDDDPVLTELEEKLSNLDSDVYEEKE